MTELALLPIPRPPHDPTSVLCDARTGWPLLRAHQVGIELGALALERSPASRRWLTEPSGSFGGLRPPANVGVAAGGIWLLDAPARALLRFDPCACRFEEVPCFGGEGDGARQLRDPRAIAVARDRLYVSDAGLGRLSVFVLPTAELAGHWAPPFAWQPSGVVVDRRGTVFVADALNGMIHRFSPFGTYLGHYDGFGAVVHLALDAAQTLYAASALEAFRVGPAGGPEPLTMPADDLAGAFTPLPFTVEATSGLILGPLCRPPTDQRFDLRGRAVAAAPSITQDRYQRSGTVVLGPLDSRIDRCTWHRVVLRGTLPDGSSIDVATFTSDVELSAGDVDDVPEHAWETRAGCYGLPEWDALVLGPPGRFLWLRLVLRGNGRTTPRLDNVEVELPRVSLRRFLPSVYGAEPRSADFTDRFLALFDRSLRDTEHAIDTIAALFDPLATLELAWLASWIGIELDRQVPEATQRALVAQETGAAVRRGTRFGLWQVLVVYLGLAAVTTTCQCAVAPGSCRPPVPTCPPAPPPESTWTPPPLILEHYQLRRWLEVGIGRLGDQAVLWGRRIVNRSQLGDTAEVGVTKLDATQDPWRDPFHVHAHRFSVFVPAGAGSTPERRRALERLIVREKPAHTDAQVQYVGPRMRIGFQSMIGLDAVVGRLPDDGVTLGVTPLGPASVVSGSGEPRAGGTRIGTTAVLEHRKR